MGLRQVILTIVFWESFYQSHGLENAGRNWLSGHKVVDPVGIDGSCIDAIPCTGHIIQIVSEAASQTINVNI